MGSSNTPENMLLVLLYYVSSVYVLVQDVVVSWNLYACVHVIISVSWIYCLPSEFFEVFDIGGQHIYIACQKWCKIGTPKQWGFSLWYKQCTFVQFPPLWKIAAGSFIWGRHLFCFYFSPTKVYLFCNEFHTIWVCLIV